MDANWAAENLAFGSGGALLQKLNRDTQKCAFKCSEITLKDGSTTMVYKDPITDKGKQSKKGKLTLEMVKGTLKTVTEGKGTPSQDYLVEVFRDGDLCVEHSFAEIRERAMIPPESMEISPSQIEVMGGTKPAKAGGCCEIM